jgi:hypothetical protein
MAYRGLSATTKVREIFTQSKSNPQSLNELLLMSTVTSAVFGLNAALIVALSGRATR